MVRQILRNADFFSFFVNLCQKDEYQLGGNAGEDTFLDAYLGKALKIRKALHLQ